MSRPGGATAATKPSAIIAQYRDGQLTREQAAQALRTAEWDDDYTRASMAPGGDYDGSDLPDEGFAVVVRVPAFSGELSAEDVDAFEESYSAWKSSR